MTGPRRSSRVAITAAGIAAVAALLALPIFAKNKTNPGPSDPPIKFNLPPSPALSPQEALKTFKVQDGLKIELAAAEPLVEDPVAIFFGADGRMWVVEMRGYMHDLNGGGEDQPIGRIKVLEGTHNDGKFDKATIFLDGLIMPRAVLPMRDGALVAEPPELAFWRANKDGKAGEKTIVATDYGRRGGQPEVGPNGLLPGLDNWIYNADHTQRYRFSRGKWLADPSRGSGQWGISQDDYGRLYYCYNTDLGRVDLLPSRYLTRNPYYKATAGIYADLLKVQAVWPSHPTPGTNRGYTATELRADGTLSAPTAACGDTIYRGDLLPAKFYGNMFTPEPAGNLVTRMILTDSQGRVTARNPYDHADFLTSTDERFRPVNCCTGPDGALYVVDMYRGVIQHSAYITNYLIKNIEARKLIDPIHLGRIYRIAPEGASAHFTRLADDTPGLVEQLAHPSGWVRDMAQRLLVEKNDPKAVPLLQKMAISGTSPLARLHALWTLEGMERLEGFVTLKALSDDDAHVRAAAVRLSEPLLVSALRPQSVPQIVALVSDPSAAVQLQVALTLSDVDDPAAEEAVANLLTASHADPALMEDAVVSGLRGRELTFAQRLLKSPQWEQSTPERVKTFADLARCVMAEHRPSYVKRLLDLTVSTEDGAWQQVALLEGMVPRTPKSKSKAATQPAVPVKLIYLDENPPSLTALLNSSHGIVKSRAGRVNARLAWPGKPGVPPPPVVIPLTQQQQAQFDRGKVIFTQLCSACHQPTGLGQDGLAPPLVDSEWVLGTDHRLVRIVLKGLTGPISVGGADYRLEMPTLSALPDDDIAATLTYIRREWEHNAAPVRVETVQQIRKEIEDRNDPWTADELLQVK